MTRTDITNSMTASFVGSYRQLLLVIPYAKMLHQSKSAGWCPAVPAGVNAN